MHPMNMEHLHRRDNVKYYIDGIGEVKMQYLGEGEGAYDMTPDVRKINLSNDVATILAGITVGVSLFMICKGGEIR